MVGGKWPGKSRDRQYRTSTGRGQHAHPHGAHLHGPADRLEDYDHHSPEDHRHHIAVFNHLDYRDHYGDHDRHRADNHDHNHGFDYQRDACA